MERPVAGGGVEAELGDLLLGPVWAHSFWIPGRAAFDDRDRVAASAADDLDLISDCRGNASRAVEPDGLQIRCGNLISHVEDSNRVRSRVGTGRESAGWVTGYSTS